MTAITEDDRCTCHGIPVEHLTLCSVTGRFAHEPCPESHTECEKPL